jgi:hypothetical protein
MKKKVLKLLYRSLDAPLGERRRARLERVLAADPALRQVRDEALALRARLAGAAQDSFRPGFAERTLARARAEGSIGARDPGFLQAFMGVARRLAVAGVLVAVLAVTYLLIKGDLLPRDAAYYISDLSLSRILQFPVF